MRCEVSKLPYAESFRDLLVYQKARNLALEIYQITKTFPREEMFSLTDQIRRSSRSVGAQISEAWAKRRYEKHFVSRGVGRPDNPLPDPNEQGLCSDAVVDS